MKYIVVLLFIFSHLALFAQNHKVTIFVTNNDKLPVESATISVSPKGQYTTDRFGRANFVASGRIKMEIRHLSYETRFINLNVISDTLVNVMLKAEAIMIGEVNITASRNKNETLEKINIDRNILSELQGNTLMSKLEELPGITSIDIGQGFSKPVIRGLYANRVAVAENGVKQQGQQWGMDHGLEIDPYAVENVAVIKGPASLKYGSDAIGGVIVVTPQVRFEDGLEITTTMNARSNNDLLGASVGSFYKKKDYFIKARISYQSYGDYRVPAKSFDYLGYMMPIYENRLKNTAGRDNSLLLSTGVKKGKLESSISFSNVYGKMGFFSGAHGIPGKGSLEPDGDWRNIDLPYQSVNHFKAISNNKLQVKDNEFWNLDIGYQFNHRQEFATPHSHGSQPLPASTLELDLRLHTFTANVEWKKYFSESINLQTGLNTEFQNNRIGGYSFLLPRFNQQSAGVFSLLSYNYNNNITLQGGVRYDYGKIHVYEHLDNYIVEGFQRATELDKSFNNFSFNIGGSFQLSSKLNFKANAGRSFRMPTANELASNGIHHGTFRYEIGDSNLKPETAYQGDLSFQYNDKLISLSISGFATYFNNYIYLDPTGRYSIELPNGDNLLLPDVGQIYGYTGERTMRWGGESDLSIHITKWMTLKNIVEYVYATDIEHNYPIPFTPPLATTNSVEFSYNKVGKIISGGKFSLSHQYTASQKRIRNEDRTPDSHIFNLLLTSNLNISKSANSKLIIGLNNIFNTCYYNHISFYRHLGLPETGRNATLSLVFTFK